MSIPQEAFSTAHNGLSFFLSQYPDMDIDQQAKIALLVEKFARPQMWRKQIRRHALQCEVRHDGVIIITPNYIKTIDSP